MQIVNNLFGGQIIAEFQSLKNKLESTQAGRDEKVNWNYHLPYEPPGRAKKTSKEKKNII